MPTTPDTNPVVHALADAANAAKLLLDAGITVVGAYANGRRAVLIIDGPPPFVVGAIKRQHPDGFGGFERVYAASYHGVQLEWIQHVRAARGMANA